MAPIKSNRKDGKRTPFNPSSEIERALFPCNIAGDGFKMQIADWMVADIDYHSAMARVAAQAVEGRLKVSVLPNFKHTLCAGTERLMVGELSIDDIKERDQPHDPVPIHQ